MKNAPLNSKTIEDYFLAPDIHEARRENRGGGITFVIALIVFAIEALLVYWTLWEKMPLALALFIHILVATALAIYSRALLNRGSENRLALLLALTVATTGPFGAAGVMLTALMQAWFSRRAQPFADWFDSLFPRTQQSGAQRIYGDIVVGRDESAKSYSVIPFLDVLSFGSETQKRQALSKMTSNFHPNFAPAFRKALNDPSNAIRVQAATASAKIENIFLQRLMKLSDLAENHPDEPVVLLALAKHYDDYAYTGLLDADRERSNRAKALEYYQAYLKLNSSDVEVGARIGRILMRSHEYDKACVWFRERLDKGYGSQAIVEWYSEALFASGRFEELRRFRASQPPVSPQNPAFNASLSEALALWSKGMKRA